MQGKTHRDAGILVVVLGFVLARYLGIVGSGYLGLQHFILMYPFGFAGSQISDQDMHPGSVPMRDPFSLGLSYLIRRTGGRHRSMHTHSEVSLLIVFSMYWLSRGGILEFAMLGFLLGFISHLLMDLLNSSGIPSVLLSYLARLLGKKGKVVRVRLVPRTPFFSTGGDFEAIVDMIIRFVGGIMFFVVLAGLIYEGVSGVKLI